MTRSRARLAAPVAAIVAGGMFWFLSHGGVASSLAVRGYVEVIDHAAAPLQAGRVARIAVHMGQHVNPGDVLAVMDTKALQLRRETARLMLARANADLRAQEVVATAAVARAELMVLRLQSTQTRNKAQLRVVRRQRTRLEKLAAEQLVNARDVEAERLKEADLVASVSVLDAAAVEGRAGLGKATGGATAVDQLSRRLEPMREAVRLREEELKLAELALEEATVRAHVEGTISAILHREGDVVPVGTELVRIANGRPGRVLCWIPDRLVQKIKAGQPTRLRGLPFFDTNFKGRVAEISPEVEEIPLRARVSAQVAAWGRRVEIESWPAHPMVLGEAVHVRF
jgi:HlyD family secretion protein